jgi:hypothetical protein
LEGERPERPKQLPELSMPSLPESGGLGGAGAEEEPVTWTWNPDTQAFQGCTRVTLFLVSDRYADVNANLPRDFNKAAILNWWVNVNPTTSVETDLVGCPGPAFP